jgi:uncharacterized membrane protein (UPF0127 family)
LTETLLSSASDDLPVTAEPRGVWRLFKRRNAVRRSGDNLEPFETGLKTIALIGPRGQVLCERCHLADRALPRIRGLIARPQLAAGEGMLLRPTWSIHTAFVRFPIDAVFLDEQMTVLAVRSKLKPWRAAWARRAHAVLELPAGRCENLAVGPGDKLGWGSV